MIDLLIWVMAVGMYSLVMGVSIMALPRVLRAVTEWDDETADISGVVAGIFWPVGLPTVVGVAMAARTSPNLKRARVLDHEHEEQLRRTRLAEMQAEEELYTLQRDQTLAKRLRLTQGDDYQPGGPIQ
jgi:hypothetical protein